MQNYGYPGIDRIYKRAYIAGFAVYAFMLVLAAVFYKERIIFTDAAFYLFNMLRKGSFELQHMRFGMFTTQVLPLLASKMGVSLSTVMLVYSENYILVYLLLYFICGTVLKRYDYALLLLFFNILFVSDTFYWPQTELPQGIALMVACFAFIECDSAFNRSVLAWPVLAVVIITIGFYHPLVAFPFFFMFLFLLLRGIAQPTRKRLYGAMVLFLVTVVIKSLLFTDKYDTSAMSGIKNFVRFFPHYLYPYPNRLFLQTCINKYYWLPALSIADIVVYVYAKQWLKLLLFICCAGGFLLLVNITHPEKTPLFYFEGLWLPLAIFVALPFIVDVLPVLQKKNMAVVAVLLILLTGCIRLYTTAAPYVARLNWERGFLDTHQNKKLAIMADCMPKDTLLMTWGTPFEFWLIGTAERGTTASIIVLEDLYRYNWAFDKTKSLIVMGCVYPYSELPKKYFHFTDTVTGYTLIKK